MGLNKSHWRKSATWFALNRKHAQVYVDEIALEVGWERVPCCDEHYLPSILAFNGLDNETTCTDGFAHVQWDSLLDSHPHTFSPDEVNEQLFKEKFNKQVGTGQGFSQLCSGNDKICHFTARKFTSAAKYQLLENIHLILNDNKTGLEYNGNPWEHLNQKLKVNGTQYYLLEAGSFREIPDTFTIEAMHLNHTLAVPLTEQDLLEHPLGGIFPSRKDGQTLKAPRNNYIYFVEGGKRRGIPDMDTLIKMGLINNISTIHMGDLEQIPLGEPMPSLKET